MKLTGIPRAASFPRMARVKQTFRGPAVESVPDAVGTQDMRLAVSVPWVAPGRWPDRPGCRPSPRLSTPGPGSVNTA